MKIVKGKQIVWGTGDVTNPVASGILTDFSKDRTVQADEITDENGDIVAVVLHGKKGEFGFDIVCEADTEAPEEGAELTIAGADSGKVICMGSTEKWSRGAAKTLSVKATWYPDME